MSTSLIPFLEMNGSANEAIDLYVKVLDAKVTYMLRFRDMPENPEAPLPLEKKDWVNYAVLKIGDSELQITIMSLEAPTRRERKSPSLFKPTKKKKLSNISRH
ncbi:hypothetical protein [Paenibacillus sp. NPDC093718]|uniref:hypothetical protein n=1 Tax=Paenibacillus sp. NPDC093718 TaxID=3390601 RepID=UPI003D041EB6